MKRIALGILFAASLLSGLNMFAQGRKSALQLADESFAERSYITAVNQYLEVFEAIENPGGTSYPYRGGGAVRKNQDFKTYQYVIGRIADCYFYTRSYTEAERWYAKVAALEEFKDLKSTMNYGSALRSNGKYDEAYVMYKKAKYMHTPEFVKNDKGVVVESEKSKEITRRINFELASAEFGANAVKKKNNPDPELMDTVKINRVGESAYAAGRMKNDKIMFTTTRFKIDNPSSKRVGDYANSFMTYHLFDSTLIRVDFGFGIDRNVVSPTFTADNMTMYFASWSAELDKPVYQIYMSKPLNDSIWEEPKLLNSIVNFPETRNLHPYVTKDGKGLYFASDRKEGFGGLDIYYVRLDEKGQPTGQAQNLGPNVNSEGDDQTPWLDEPSQTLFFSSTGWIGMGGLDNFFVHKKYEEWSKPTNLGYPINSSRDDAYLATSPNTNVAFFSSDRNGTCCYELYTVDLNLYTVKGKVVDANDETPLGGVKVVFYNKETGGEMLTTYTDASGMYYGKIMKGLNYSNVYTKLGYIDNDLQFNTNSAIPLDTMELPLVKMLSTDIGRTARLEDIYYDFNKATLRPESFVVLDRLARNLRKFPYLVIELGSHTDNVGSDDYNQRLSQERAKSAVEYLISQGVARESIIAKGYGESQPRVPNENPDGSDNPENRQINRRTEFKVLDYKTERGGTN
ncbi:MAG TPA: OmpA family protein [Luteibaculaceae bacterium]|nr:OmpA family protein [Luteibaculaceae bacterium]